MKRKVWLHKDAVLSVTALHRAFPAGRIMHGIIHQGNEKQFVHKDSRLKCKTTESNCSPIDNTTRVAVEKSNIGIRHHKELIGLMGIYPLSHFKQALIIFDHQFNNW
jgi:hypothetical protein